MESTVTIPLKEYKELEAKLDHQEEKIFKLEDGYAIVDKIGWTQIYSKEKLELRLKESYNKIRKENTQLKIVLKELFKDKSIMSKHEIIYKIYIEQSDIDLTLL